MLNIIGEIWKAQQYALCECSFEVPQTFYLQGSRISHYFTSTQCPGKILKKRKENTTLKSILETFNSKDKHVCSFSRLVNKKEVLFRYLNRTELETLIADVSSFSDLYQDVILQSIFPSENFITYKRQGHVTQIQQRIPLSMEPLITLKDSQFVCEKVIFENRVNRAGECIEKLLSLTQGSSISEIELFFKYIGDKLIIVWNTCFVNSNNKRHLNYTNTQNYLYNQELYEQYQPKKQIDENQEMVQCGGCRKLMKITDSFEVLKNRIWKIRMHRNLHHLNDQKIICDANGRIQPRLDEFQFVRVCGLCYNSFIETISNTKLISSNRKRIPQQQEYSQLQILKAPRRKLFKFADKDGKSYLGSRTNSTQVKDKRMTPQLNSTFDENYESIQQQRVEMDEDFDELLNEVKNDLRTSYQSGSKVCNKIRIQSAQNNNKFKLYYQ